MNKSQKGFTIIELIVVVAIVAILSGIVTMNTTSVLGKAKQSRAKEEVAEIQKSLVMFYAKYGDYPGQQYVEENGWGNQFYPSEWGGQAPNLVKNGNTYYLTEFQKLDWDSGNGASWFGNNSYYSLNLYDLNADSKIGCAWMYVWQNTEPYGCVMANVLCQDCPGECGYYYSYDEWCI